MSIIKDEKRENYLHKIFFYKDKKGNEPVLDYLRELSEKSDKDSRIKANKINIAGITEV